MTRTATDAGGVTRPQHSIHIGGVFASATPAIVRTVLGSCIAVCLRDALTQTGGMNHFMLPCGGEGEQASTRYGIHAMELLINEVMRLGGDRRRLEAKVFGGGHVLRVAETSGNVPQSNIAFALRFLEQEDIPIQSRDLGGYAAREIHFYTDTGRTLLKRLGEGSKEQRVQARLDALQTLEREQMQQLARPTAASDDSNITLF